MNLQGNRITWLGHATFRIETKDGVTVYVDPWVMGNPACPESEKQVKKADVLICTHGHMDHIGDAVQIAKQHNPIVVGIFELCTWVGKKGAKQIAPMNKGGHADGRRNQDYDDAGGALLWHSGRRWQHRLRWRGMRVRP